MSSPEYLSRSIPFFLQKIQVFQNCLAAGSAIQTIKVDPGNSIIQGFSANIGANFDPQLLHRLIVILKFVQLSHEFGREFGSAKRCEAFDLLGAEEG